MLEPCRRLLAVHYPRHGTRATQNPKSVIWAGVAYSQSGAVLDPVALPAVAKAASRAAAAA